MTERELLVDCLRRLNRTGVAYYLTGSMASNYWGIPRSTHDLDFVVQLPQAAVPGIVQEFSRDFYIEEAAVWAVDQPPHQFNAIDTRSALNVDFWLARAEVNVRTSSGALRWLRKLPIEIPCLLHYSILTAKLFSTRRRELLEKRMAHFLLHRTGAING